MQVSAAFRYREVDMSVSAKPASGMRDFLAQDVLRRQFVIERIVQAYRAHGFQPLETPAIERLDVLTAKYGAEGDQLMFKLLVRAEKLQRASIEDPASLSDLALHYDLTVPMARAYARHRNDLPRYYKRYQIQPVWRADRPQRGRFREFYQCDVDYVGSTSLLAEVEVLSSMLHALQNLSFDGVVVRLNDRRLLAAMLQSVGVAEADRPAVLVTLDKLDKIGEDGVQGALQNEHGMSEERSKRLLGIAHAASTLLPDEALRTLGAKLSEAGCDTSSVESLRRLFALLPPVAGITLRFDPSLVRGMSYYTGTIMEFGAEGLSGSIAGGGRYDGLVGMFLNEDVPAVGGSLGLERILVIMEERGMFPDLSVHSDVLVAQLDEEALPACLQLAEDLRRAGYAASVFPDATKIGKQFRYAEEIGARYVAILGKRELEEGVVAFRELATGEQTKVPHDKASDYLAQR